MIGIILGVLAAIGYIAAAWSGNAAYFTGTGGGMILLGIVGVLLFPKSVARYLGVILAAAPIAIIIGFFTGVFVPAIVFAVAAAVTAFVVKLFRPRARNV